MMNEVYYLLVTHVWDVNLTYPSSDHLFEVNVA